MKNFRNFLGKAVLCLSLGASINNAFGQNDQDAMRYSQNDLIMSARSAASGGAFGAVGGEYGSGFINPASHALVRRNMFSLTGAMMNSKNQMSYLGSNKAENEFSLQLPSVGFVFNNTRYVDRKPATKGWINTNFAIGAMRTNSYNDVRYYTGTNTDNSMLDYFAQRSNGLSPEDLQATQSELDYGYNYIETMVYESYLIDHAGNNIYVANYNPNDKNFFQKNTIQTGGGMHTFNANLSSNYQNMFYIGGGIDINTVNYSEKNRFREVDESSKDDNWSQWTLDRNLKTKGWGVGANLGIIFKPTSSLRVGAAVKTPVIYNLSDTYSDQLETQFDDGSSLTLSTLTGKYDYKVVSPLKTTLSAAYVFGKSGFISTDFEIVDYSTVRLRPVISAFEIANDNIQSNYGKGVNIRVGGEYVYQMFRIRGGVAHYASPLVSPTDNNLSNLYYTGGIGLQENNWSLDMAVLQKNGNEIIQPYTLDGAQVPYAVNKQKRNYLLVTLSTRF